MTASISVIIPTLGRPSLARALRSVIDQGPHEVIVIADRAGDAAHARRVAEHFVADTFLECDSGEFGKGYEPREHGITQATGTHLAFLDDDDAMLPGALAAMRERACDRPVIFRMAHPAFPLIWAEPVVRWANVGTPMILVPNDPARLGEWKPDRQVEGVWVGGDYTFLAGCVEAMGEPLWDERVVCQVRPS